MDGPPSFGQWLRRRRRELDLTQDALARQVGCARVTIRKLEGDDIRPSKQLAELLAEQLGIPSAERNQFIQFARTESKAGQPPQPGQAAETAPWRATPAQGRELPAGTVTLMFSDIAGSTLLRRGWPDEYTRVLAEERQLWRGILERWNGREVDTESDAIFAAFARAGDAANAVAEAQRALAAHPWPEGMTVRVRVGLHTGAPQVTPTGYVGIDVHRAARIGAVAHGGQVLLSNETRALIGNGLPPGLSLHDLGEHQLKDLPHAERLFQLVIADLPSHFPPLKSSQTPLHNLPVPLTTFIGRERELAAVRQLLDAARLVTLAGPGGIGKTRLAIEAARTLLDAPAYPDGLLWVELAPLRDPALVVQAVASIRDVRESSNQSLVEALTSYLRARRLLLILDNCEHLILACAQLAERLLANCAGVRILATSREPLDIAGETTWPVPSLSLPRPGLGLAAAALEGFESTRLFTARSRLVQPAFAPTDQNAAVVAQICRRLDGMPLAIELAAARVKLMSLDEIARRLDDRFALLTAGSRTALPRQQTLRAAIDWSFDLLPEAERVLLRRVAVFAGGFTLEAAEAVCGDGRAGTIARQPVLALLGHLVNKSLITVGASEAEQAEPTRYTLLETVREYARHKLEQAGEAGQVQDRHLEYFMRLAEEAEPELLTDRQLWWFARLEDEIDNLRAAAQRAATADGPGADRQHEAGLRLLAALYWFFERVHRREASERLEQLLSQPRSPLPNQARARALLALGVLLWQVNRFADARAALEAVLPVFRQLGDQHGLAWTLAYLGLAALSAGDQATAQAMLEETIAIARDLGPAGQPTLGYGLALYGNLAAEQGDEARAAAYYQQSNTLLAALGDKNFRGHPVRHWGYIALRQGDFAGARARFVESLGLNREVGHHLGVIASMLALGALALETEDYPRAARLAGAIEARLTDLNATFYAFDEAEYRRFMSALRAVRPPADLEAAWAAGRAMTIDDAIDYALS